MNSLINNSKYFGKDNRRAYVTSNWIAKVTDKRVDHVKRDITRYYNILSTTPDLGRSEFFKPSKYKARNGEMRSNYHCYLKGCEMYANKMTGKRGIIFTAKFVNKFHNMQKQLTLNKAPQTYADALIAYGKQLKLTKKYKKDSNTLHRFLNIDAVNNISDIASKFVGLTARHANNLLHKAGVQYKRSPKDRWHLYKSFIKKHPYLATTTYFPIRFNNTVINKYSLKWVNRGYLWLCQFFLKHGFKLVDDVPQPQINHFLQKRII